MTTLTRCPLCGANSGYTLHEGSSSKWWAIHCPACGEQVSECRSGYVDPPEGRTQGADEAWNEAGKYAQGLRGRVDQLEQFAIPGCTITEYSTGNEISVRSARQRDGSIKWKVVDQGGNVLSLDGQWQFEPMPSGRTDEFLRMHRFSSAREALDCLHKTQAAA